MCDNLELLLVEDYVVEFSQNFKTKMVAVFRKLNHLKGIILFGHMA